MGGALCDLPSIMPSWNIAAAQLALAGALLQCIVGEAAPDPQLPAEPGVGQVGPESCGLRGEGSAVVVCQANDGVGTEE